MINILVIIIIILLLIILSLLITKYFLINNEYDNKFNTIYNKSDKSDKIYNIESFSNNKNNITENSNLIKNGNFENGVMPNNFVNQSGINKVVSIKNPGNSSYALQQKKSKEITYYQLTCDNNINSKYILLFWVCITDKNNNQPNINDVNFESLIKIKIQNQDFTNFIPKLNYNIIQKTTISENNYNWYLLKYDFLSGSENLDKMQIYLNYSDSLQFDMYYFTDLSLFRVLIDAQNFTHNNNLVCYTDGYNYQSNSTTWHDLSGNGNDLFWSKIPDANITIGSLNTSNLSLTCMKSSVLLNTSTTIALCLNQDIINEASDNYINTSEEEHHHSTNNFYLLSVPGNNRYAFELKIVNNKLYLIIDNKEYKSVHDFIFYNKSLLFITYNGSSLNIYQDGLLLISVVPRKLYFNNNKIIINRNKNLNINLYSTLFYNRVINTTEMNDIREYFITNKNKNYNQAPDINRFQMNNYFLDSINGNYPTYQPYDKKRSCEYNNLNNSSSTFDNTFNNTSDKIKKAFVSCNKDCIEECLPKSIHGLKSFYDCASTCKTTLDSCKNLCKSDPQNPYYCNMKNELLNSNISNCPKVIKKKGNYVVYIPENSNYAKELKYSGEKIYSNNIQKARTLYNLNFPECPTPKELILKELNNNSKSCPFVVNESNPCITSACSGVNWNKDNYKELSLSKNCKKMVSNYCNINYELDDKCICWDPKYKDDKRCNEFRGFFDEPNEFCTPSQFSIEDHPDFGKYIKKDNIPCWGCKI